MADIFAHWSCEEAEARAREIEVAGHTVRWDSSTEAGAMIDPFPSATPV